MPAVEYGAGHVKRDPVSGWVAVRTVFPETDQQFQSVAWLIATTSMGSKNCSTVDVAGWDDLFIPDPVPETD